MPAPCPAAHLCGQRRCAARQHRASTTAAMKDQDTEADGAPRGIGAPVTRKKLDQAVHIICPGGEEAGDEGNGKGGVAKA